MGFFSNLAALGTVGLLLYAVLTNAIASFRNNEAIEGTVELHIWPVKFLMVVGLVFFLRADLPQHAGGGPAAEKQRQANLMDFLSGGVLCIVLLLVLMATGLQIGLCPFC